MFERYSDRRAPAKRRLRRNAVAIAASVLTNGLLLLGLGAGLRSVRLPEPQPETQRERILYVEFPEPEVTRDRVRSIGESPPGKSLPHAPLLPHGLGDAQVAEFSTDQHAAGGDTLPSTAPASDGGALFRAGFQDARLYVDPYTSTPSSPLSSAQERAAAGIHAAIRATRDSLAAEKRDIAYSLEQGYYASGMKIMPADGVAWQVHELLQQRKAFTRDSVLQARIRAVRERKNAARDSIRTP